MLYLAFYRITDIVLLFWTSPSVLIFLVNTNLNSVISQNAKLKLTQQKYPVPSKPYVRTTNKTGFPTRSKSRFSFFFFFFSLYSATYQRPAGYHSRRRSSNFFRFFRIFCITCQNVGRGWHTARYVCTIKISLCVNLSK